MHMQHNVLIHCHTWQLQKSYWEEINKIGDCDMSLDESQTEISITYRCV